MIMYDFECKCGKEFECIVDSYEVFAAECECGELAQRMFPTRAPQTELKYNPQKDMVDWDGNRSRYWDDYKQQKSEGKDVRIPKHDGDG